MFRPYQGHGLGISLLSLVYFAIDNKDVDVIKKTLTNEQVLKEEISNNAKREPVTVVIKSK